jgi:hypothetical protein
MGNLVNSVVILVSMAIFGEVGSEEEPLTSDGSKNVIALMFGESAWVEFYCTL